MMRVFRWWVFLAIGFYLSAILTVFPLPQSVQWYRPQWMLMFVIACQLMQPKLFNALIAWGIGILVDVLLGTPLGEHALVYAVICYITAFMRPKLILEPIWTQLGKIFLLVCLGQISLLWFHVFAGQNPQTLLYWFGTVTSCLVWPAFAWLLRVISQLLLVPPLFARR